MDKPVLGHLDSTTLADRLKTAVATEHRALLSVLFLLAEVYQRNLHLIFAFPSLFAYCTDELGYPKAAAFRRSHAARLIALHPLVGDYLLAGKITVTNLVALHRILRADNCRELLDAISGKSEQQVKELVAELVPALEPHGGTITPAAPGRQLLQVYVSDAFVQDFAEARDLLSHSIPYGEPELVLHAALRAVIKAKLGRRRGAEAVDACAR